MDSFLIFSWFAYGLCSLLLMLATWKLLAWLPFSVRCSLVLSQLAILMIPAPVHETALAPAFIVVVLDVLSGFEMTLWLPKALPLLLALIAAWPLGFAWGWIRQRQLAASTQAEAEAAENKEVNP